MIHLVRDPSGDSVFGPTTTTIDTSAMHVTTKSTALIQGQRDEVVQLKQRVLELEKELNGKGML